MKKNIIEFSVYMLFVIFFSCTDKKDDPDKYRKGWTLVWEEDFNAPLDTTVWKKISPEKHLNKYMGEKDNLYMLQDGNLILRGTHSPSVKDHNSLQTGGVTRIGINENETGRIEIKAAINPCSGAWPFIRLLPENRNNIAISIMEQYDLDTFIYQSVSTEYTTTKKMTDNPPSIMMVGVNPNQYHIYGLEKYPDSLVFFVDGIRTRKYPRIQTSITGQFPFNNLDLNLYLGMGINKNNDTTAVTADMFIDWVRYYKPATSL